MKLRYVVQMHTQGNDIHWDLMLEQVGVDRLATWQVSEPPDKWQRSASVTCRKIFDHRAEYLTYQGPVSNDRGTVAIVEQGYYQLIERRSDCWQIILSGKLLTGKWSLKRIGSEGIPNGYELSWQGQS